MNALTPATRDHRIESWFKDSRGRWLIILAAGFIDSRHGVHALQARLQKDALAQLVRVVPCSCAECQERAAHSGVTS